jgi:hypothetical protein
LEARRIRLGVSWDRQGNVAWVDDFPPHRHIDAFNITAITARTNYNIHAVGPSNPLPKSLAAGTRNGKFDVDFCTSALRHLVGLRFSRSMTQSYPFALSDGGWLAPMAVKLAYRLATLEAIHRFHGMRMGDVDSRSLRS